MCCLHLVGGDSATTAGRLEAQRLAKNRFGDEPLLALDEFSASEDSITIAIVASFIDADRARDEAIAGWPLVRDRAELESIQVVEYSPIAIAMSLAEQPTVWSVATATRPVAQGIDREAIWIAIAEFVRDLVCQPMRDA